MRISRSIVFVATCFTALNTLAFADQTDDLISKLKTPQRGDAIRELKWLDDVRAVKPLFEVIDDEIADCVEHKGGCAWSAPGAISNLYERASSPTRKEHGPEMISAIDREVVALSKRMADSKNTYERSAIMTALGWIRSSAAINPLLVELEKPEGGWALRALVALGWRSLQPVKDWTLTKTGNMGRAGVQIIAQINRRGARKALNEIIAKHTDPAIKAYATETLPKLKKWPGEKE